jgi:hypothetical protein
MPGVFSVIFQLAHLTGQAVGTGIGWTIRKALERDPEPPPPRERKSGEADFVSHDELKRRGIIDER